MMHVLNFLGVFNMSNSKYKSIRILSNVYDSISMIAADSRQTLSKVIESWCSGAQYLNGRIFSTRNLSDTGTIIYAIDFDRSTVQMLHNYPDINSETPGVFYHGVLNLSDFLKALAYFEDLRKPLSARMYQHAPEFFTEKLNIATRNNYGFFKAIFDNFASVCKDAKIDIPLEIKETMAQLSK
jgi:hypothetical protein